MKQLLVKYDMKFIIVWCSNLSSQKTGIHLTGSAIVYLHIKLVSVKYHYHTVQDWYQTLKLRTSLVAPLNFVIANVHCTYRMQTLK